jgi:hypothetical protein
MTGLPQRQPLTATTARKTPLRTLLDRIEEFRKGHPGIRVSAPYSNASGQWETYSADYGTGQWENGRKMLEALPARHSRYRDSHE